MAQDPSQQSTDSSQQGNESEGSQLRRKLEEALEENKQLKSERRTRAFKDAGLDPEKGIGKAVASLYSGEVDPESIREFAKTEFEWEPQASGEQSGDGGGNDGLSEQEQQRLTGEQRLQNVSGGSLPSRDPSINDEANEALAEGKLSDFDRSAARSLLSH